MKTDVEKMEVKVYAFSINVISFVKSMEKAGTGDEPLQILVHSAKQFYDLYIDYVDEEDEDTKPYVLKECLKYGNKCLDILQNMGVPEEFLNEKVDLVIDVAGLIKKMEENE
ncbi:MAG: hypothetical protein L3J74_18480 [Bacteroidales bacterium]|nr:hypothetical protein [Bacteroidales bacterium]